MKCKKKKCSNNFVFKMFSWNVWNVHVFMNGSIQISIWKSPKLYSQLCRHYNCNHFVFHVMLTIHLFFEWIYNFFFFFNKKWKWFYTVEQSTIDSDIFRRRVVTTDFFQILYVKIDSMNKINRTRRTHLVHFRTCKMI